ncbi:MAG: ATP-binding cassette domain-containing protein [Acidobacteria bacterium]|nr:ATP-binding cassette domain-containing protein [Acidobacteriota bacterium]
MVASILPFLSVLAEPERIHTRQFTSYLYRAFGFTSDFRFLVALGVASTVVILLAAVVQVVRSFAVARFAMMRTYSISSRLVEVYLGQPYEFFLNRHSGTLSTQILSESQQVVTQFFRPAAEAIASGLTVTAVVALLFWINPTVALITFGLLGGTYGIALMFSRQMLARMGLRRLEANKARFKVVNEALGGVKYLKLTGRERAYLNRYARPARDYAAAQVGVMALGEMPQYVLQAIAFGGAILFCLALLEPEDLGSGAALGGIVPLVGVFAFGAQRMMPELSRLYRGITQMRYAAPAVEAVYKDMQRPIDDLPKSPPAPLRFRHEMRLDNVCYRYPNSSAGLDRVSMSIRAGEKIGIVGSTGSGKTTLADVVLGLLWPQSGTITVDGAPITKENQRAWRQAVGYVPQEIFLTDSSVAENIALGLPRKQIDIEKVVRAAEAAQIDAFVRESMPQGYETFVGERGVRLSGGQRQRLGIARALYGDADLILFDEATSALDNLTEREVISAINALPGDKTILMIAHRLSTLGVCDRILVLKNGRVAGLGTFQELLESNGEFRAIAHAVEAA